MSLPLPKNLVCPSCSRKLKREGRGPDGVLICAECGPYPLVAGIPVLIARPQDWCATYFDSAVSTLAEHNRISPSGLAVLSAFRAHVSHPSAEVFADDWTAAEVTREPDEAWLQGPAFDALSELSAVAADQSPAEWLLHRVPRGKRVLEVGPGAGLLTEKLAAISKQVIVGDTSLRALMNSVRFSPPNKVFPIVMSAEAIPLSNKSVDVVVAENVVDLLSTPADFFESAASCLTADGTLLISTPDPSLGDPADQSAMQLLQLASAAGFTPTEQHDGLPWLRRHSARRAELYLVKTVAFAKR